MRNAIIAIGVIALAVIAYFLFVGREADQMVDVSATQTEESAATNATTTPSTDNQLASVVPAPAAEMVLHRGNGTEPETIDPQKSTGVTEANIEYELFEGLTTYSVDGDVVPGAAESWEISDDGKTYTFHLRKDGKWSNGDPVTAGDFVYAFRRLLDPALASDYAFIIDMVVNAEQIRKGEEKDPTKLAVEAVDDHTLKISLKNSTPYFLGLLRHNSVLPVHQKSIEAHPEDWTKPGNLVGNGAFTLSEWTPQASLTMVKNPNFHDAANVKLDKIVMYPTEDIAEELKRFQAGELHVTNDLPSEQIPWLKENMKDELSIEPYLGTYYYSINLTREPLGKQKEIREALAMAIDRELLIDKITQAGQMPAYAWVPPGLIGYTQAKISWADMPMDARLARAKELMTAAGYGPDNPLKFEILYNTSENHKKIAVAIQSMWKAIGAEVTLNNQEWKVYLETRDKKEFDVVRAAWIGDYADPQTFLTLFLSDAGEANDAGFNNPDYDRLTKTAEAITDQPTRMKQLTEAEQIFLDNLPIIPIYHYTTKHMISKKLSGWKFNILDFHLGRYISVEG
jgi:oligopeptide transport system substrate-binding protein